MKRSWLRHMSNQQRKKVARRAEPRRQQLAQYPYCEPHRAGMPGRCWGELTVHEPWPRGRGGPIDDRGNMTSVCSEGNRLISQDANTMAWAYLHGFLVHSYAGPSWLCSGGFHRVKEQEA